jgi:hypothetical protein
MNKEGGIYGRGNSEGMGDDRKYLHAGVVRNKSNVAGTGGCLWMIITMVEMMRSN